MSKNISKEDQQLEDAGRFVISIFQGIGKGIKAMKEDQQKLVLFLFITLASIIVYYSRGQICARLIPGEEGFHVLKVMLKLALSLPLIALYMIGTAESGSQSDYEKKFAEISFCARNKTYPKFLGKENDGKKVIYSFYSVGLDLKAWIDNKSLLEQAFNCRIVKVGYAPSTRQAIRMHTVPATSDLKTMLQWSNSYIRENDFEVVLGIALLEDVVFNLNKLPHMLIASVTGGGKSVLLRCILWQCIKKGAKVYMIDFKGGVEFGMEYEQYGEVVTERQEALEMLKELTLENALRLKLFREVGVKNIAEYNELFPDKPLCRVVLLCDEVSEMLDKTGLGTEDKRIFSEIEKELSTLARLGRAPGVNMILATQRPDANVLTGQVKNNLPIRISGRMMDDPASKMVLGNTEATKIDDEIKGRFMYNVGADTYEFQGYLFTEGSLEKGPFQRGSMLIDGSADEKFPVEEDFDYDEIGDECEYGATTFTEELEGID